METVIARNKRSPTNRPLSSATAQAEPTLHVESAVCNATIRNADPPRTPCGNNHSSVTESEGVVDSELPPNCFAQARGFVMVTLLESNVNILDPHNSPRSQPSTSVPLKPSLTSTPKQITSLGVCYPSSPVKSPVAKL